MAIISTLTDTAGRRGNLQPEKLVTRIEAAVLGYIGALPISGSDAGSPLEQGTT